MRFFQYIYLLNFCAYHTIHLNHMETSSPYLHPPIALSLNYMHSVMYVKAYKSSLCLQMSFSVSLSTGGWSFYLVSLPHSENNLSLAQQ